MKKILRLWHRLLVFFGIGYFGVAIKCTPNHQRCPFHSIEMKRIGLTTVGARYYCPKCKSSYNLEGGGIKIIPV